MTHALILFPKTQISEAKIRVLVVYLRGEEISRAARKQEREEKAVTSCCVVMT